ncbi:MAG: hypothetical protein ABGZ53_22760 [Fuerstiella sp.]
MNIRFGHKVGIEGDDGNGDVSISKFLFVLTQLRHMLTAGDSAQMSVEYQQQPTAFVIGKPMFTATNVRQ